MAACMWLLGLIACGAPAKPDPYDVARAKAVRQERALVVLCGGSWCAPCREAERLYGPRLRAKGVFVHIDVDAHRRLLKALRLTGPWPTLIVFPRAHGRWLPRRVFVELDGIKLFVDER